MSKYNQLDIKQLIKVYSPKNKHIIAPMSDANKHTPIKKAKPGFLHTFTLLTPP